MAVIPRRNNKNRITSYFVRVRNQEGEFFPSKSFTRKEEAINYESLLKNRSNCSSLVATQDAYETTFNEYWDVWCHENRADVSEGWKISQDQMCRDFIAPIIGCMKIADIKIPHIGAVLNCAKEKGKGPQLRKHIYSLMHRLFGDAKDYYGMIPVNPVVAALKPKVPNKERAFLTPNESRKLLEHVEHDYLGPAIWIQLLAGLRPSEVQALRWENVRFDQGVILIHESYNVKEGRLQNHPKQKDSGSAPLGQKLREYLEPRKGAHSAFVAPSIKGSMLPYGTYLRAVKRKCAEANVREVTPHELRHSCTELFFEAGASTQDVSRVLNHKNIQSTQKYIHRTQDRLSILADRVGEPGSLKLVIG
jgi:integrase